jgi:membrane protease YdiL (CAAX protease family)
VFGIGLTSAIFAMLHIQALFSLGMFIFFAIGLVFGWLRQRYSTTAAVIAHFSFNFLPFLLASLVTVQ